MVILTHMDNEPEVIGQSTQVTDALALAAEFASYALSEGTRYTYRRAFAVFTERCDRLGLTPLPCTEETLLAVLGVMAGEGLTASRLGVIVSAVGKCHRMAKLPDPTASEQVKLVLKGVKKTRGAAPNKKKALYGLVRPDQEMSDLDRVLKQIGDYGLVAKRDRSIVLLGFAAALRRSEIAGLEIGDLDFVADGLVLTIRESKGDRNAKGQHVSIPHGTPGKCPVAALREWLRVAEVPDDKVRRTPEEIALTKVYRGVRRNGVLYAGMTPQAIGVILKRRFRTAGLDPVKYSAHSLRSGFLTSAADDGADVWSLMASRGISPSIPCGTMSSGRRVSKTIPGNG